MYSRSSVTDSRVASSPSCRGRPVVVVTGGGV